METKAKPPKLAEIAQRITAHLKRMESDQKINTPGHNGGPRYYGAFALPDGRKARITYLSYEGSIALKKADALKYLEWLDAGNNGRHWEALREVSNG